MKFCGMPRISLNAPDGTFPDTHVKSERHHRLRPGDAYGDASIVTTGWSGTSVATKAKATRQTDFAVPFA
jgi:hypothetical protein